MPTTHTSSDHEDVFVFFFGSRPLSFIIMLIKMITTTPTMAKKAILRGFIEEELQVTGYKLQGEGVESRSCK
jgi:hypothetical protein